MRLRTPRVAAGPILAILRIVRCSTIHAQGPNRGLCARRDDVVMKGIQESTEHSTKVPSTGSRVRRLQVARRPFGMVVLIKHGRPVLVVSANAHGSDRVAGGDARRLGAATTGEGRR